MNNNVDLEQELIDQLAEEFAERCRRGQQPAIEDYARRHPTIADRLRELLPSVALMEQLKRNRRPAGPQSGNDQNLERLGDYRILREVGRGGMGIVYEARQESLDRRVALKVLPRHSLLDPKRLARFRVEAQAAARMHHTNIVPVFGLFESDGLFYYAMQLIEGQGLHEVLASLQKNQHARDTKGTRGNNKPTRKYSGLKPAKITGPLSFTTDADPTGRPVTPARLPVAVGTRPLRGYWDQVAAIGLQVADALQYAHDQGALHRDIKPANLLLDGSGTVWITDFGLAKLLEQHDLTSTGDVVGTLQYMAPESIQGQSDARSDIYSLGLTLYELLTLEAPFEESNPARLLKLVTQHEPIPPRRRNPAIPRDLETIVLKAIAREPDHRYHSSRALAADLRRFLEDRPIKARRAAPLERAWRWCRRNRALAALAAIAVNSLLLAAIAGWWGYASTRRALKNESVRRSEAEVATKRAEANVQLSLAALQSIFAALAERQPPPAPPKPAGGPPQNGPPRDGRQHDGPPEMAHGPGGLRRQNEPPADQDEFDAALLQTVLTFYDRFAERNATDPKLKIEAAQAYCRVAEAQSRLGKPDQAVAAYGRAALVCELVRKEFPDDPRAALTLGEVNTRWAALGMNATDAAEQTKSQARAKLALKLAGDLLTRFPQEPDYLALQAHAEQTLARLLDHSGKLADAEAHYRHAIVVQQGLVQISGLPHPRLDHFEDELEKMQRGLVKFLLGASRPADAKKFLDSTIATLDSARPSPHVQCARAELYSQYADLLTELGETQKAIEMQDKADDIRDRRRPEPPPKPGEPPQRRGPPDGPGGGPPGAHPHGHHSGPGRRPPPEDRGPPLLDNL